MILRHVILVAVASSALFSTLAQADRTAEELYPRTCSICHAAGVANAPKTGDVEAWQARKDVNDDAALIEIVKTGLNAMPPKGMCMDCTDGEFQALIDFMASGGAPE